MESFAMVLPRRQLHATQPKENSLRKVADLKVWSEWTVSWGSGKRGSHVRRVAGLDSKAMSASF